MNVQTMQKIYKLCTFREKILNFLKKKNGICTPSFLIMHVPFGLTPRKKALASKQCNLGVGCQGEMLPYDTSSFILQLQIKGSLQHQTVIL